MAGEKWLLTFVGSNDPFSKRSAIGEEASPGPILSLLKQRKFSRIILLSNPGTALNGENTVAQIRKLHPDIQVNNEYFQHMTNPTDYQAILPAMRAFIREKIPQGPGQEIFVSATSGTPQMTASWLFLVSSRELPAKVLYVPDPSKSDSSVVEVDMDDPVFPTVYMPQRRAGNATDTETEASLSAVLDDLGIKGQAPAFREALESARRFARLDIGVDVLITGETGTGKEGIAQLIHRLSPRRDKLFVKINSGAIPDSLAAGILFGHEKGTFTGADATRKGLFEETSGGTIFLDEVEAASPPVQVDLLRVLQEREISRVGNPARSIKVDVRIIAATNIDLEKEVQEGHIRKDFFQRLNVCSVHLPPLRERKEDIPILASFFLEKWCRQWFPEETNFKQLSPEAMELLCRYSWPGNVRELENVIKRAIIKTDGRAIPLENLDILDPQRPDPFYLPELGGDFNLPEYMEKLRKAIIQHALEKTEHRQAKAARLLGISPQAISKELKKYF